MSDAGIKVRCPRCLGTGYDDNSTIDNLAGSCIPCGGTGYTVKDKLDITDIMNDLTVCKRRLKKIMDKLEVGE